MWALVSCNRSFGRKVILVYRNTTVRQISVTPFSMARVAENVYKLEIASVCFTRNLVVPGERYCRMTMLQKYKSSHPLIAYGFSNREWNTSHAAPEPWYLEQWLPASLYRISLTSHSAISVPSSLEYTGKRQENQNFWFRSSHLVRLRPGSTAQSLPLLVWYRQGSSPQE